MKRFWISLVAAGLLTIAALGPAAAQNGNGITLDFEEQDDSGISGSVRLDPQNGETLVTVLLTEGLEDGAVHPVHIHEGTCDDLGSVAYPLDDIEDGSSESTVEVSLDELLEGDYAVNAHLSADEMAVNIACANISEEDAVDDDDAAVDDDDATTDDDDDAVTDDDDAAVDDDDATTDDDDAAVDDDATTDDDDAVEEEADDTATDDVVVDDAAEDDSEEVLPATGSTNGMNADPVAIMMLLAGAVLGIGVLVRSRMPGVQSS